VDLAQQHRRRNPARLRGFDPRLQVLAERIELLRSRGARLVPTRIWIAQIPPHRVTRDAELARDLLHLPAAAGQYSDFHCLLLSQHPRGPKGRIFAQEGVNFTSALGGQNYIGGDTYRMRARCTSQLRGKSGRSRGIGVLEPGAELRRPRPGIIEAYLGVTT